MYKLRWVNETGGDWIDSSLSIRLLADMNEVEAAVKACFDDGYLDDGDIVQVYAWDADHIGDDPVAEYAAEDFAE